MKLIAIHNSKAGFHSRWIAYCEEKAIPYKLVNCFANNIIQELQDCDALMWHHSQNDPKALLVAKQILFAIEHSGKVVFPNFKTNWHFDDKVGQKYLLESVNCDTPQNYVFLTKQEAKAWAKNTTYPVVFKLRRGAGSFNVMLIKNYYQATQAINKSFGRGYSNYNSIIAFKEILKKKKTTKINKIDLIKSLARLFIKPKFTKITGKESGYVYFQEFIPDNSYDVRVIVIGDKAFAIKRTVRTNDFRASGSGIIEFGKNNFDDKTIRIAFEVADKLSAQCIAFDFVYKENDPLIVEISYGYSIAAYDPCEGYWDKNLNWFDGGFDSAKWMVDVVINEIERKKQL